MSRRAIISIDSTLAVEITERDNVDLCEECANNQFMEDIEYIKEQIKEYKRGNAMILRENMDLKLISE
jgi:hypothetical protein